MVNKNVPITLNDKWIKPVRFAFVLVPIHAIKAVTQVPILDPKTINNALEIGKAPCPTIIIIKPVTAEEDWIKAVKAIPIKIKSNGKLIEEKILQKLVLISSFAKAALIKSNPIKIKPNPHKIDPIFFTFWFLKNIIITPIKANTDVNKDILRLDKETIIPVMVVPIFAPIIIAVACIKLITPAFTNPITITLVAEELWINAVTEAPTPTPAKRLLLIHV